MKKIFGFLLFLILLGVIPLAMFQCDNSPLTISITEIDIKTTTLEFQEVDTSWLLPYDEVAKAITFSDYDVLTFNDYFPTFSSYALSPAPPNIVQEFAGIRVEAMNSFSLTDSGSPIVPGTDISSKFHVITNGHPDNPRNIEDFISINKIWDSNDVYYLQLAEKPTSKITMILKITIEMTDGKIYAFEREILNVE